MKLTAQEKSNARLAVLAALLLLLVLNAGTAWSMLGTLWGIVFPIVLGGVLAFVLNIPMKALERVVFPNARNAALAKARRPLCFVASLALIALVLVLVVALVVPELLNALGLIVREAIDAANGLRAWAVDNSDRLAQLASALPDPSGLDEDQIKERLVQFAGQGAAGLLGVVTRVTSGVVNFSFGIIFAIYLLMGKETLARQARAVGVRYLGEGFVRRAHRALVVAQDKFEQFIVGQCVEALILGVLCTVGMLVLRLPYAPMVGALIAATSLIPIVGAYVGGTLAAFMIFSVDPMQAVVFLVFLVLLQQFEGNVIYPRTVGNALQLPGLWVTAAVTLGAGFAGIPGMLVGVPLAATLYDLLKEDVRRNLPDATDGMGSADVANGHGGTPAADDERKSDADDAGLQTAARPHGATDDAPA